jgi:hypothetical protein
VTVTYAGVGGADEEYPYAGGATPFVLTPTYPAGVEVGDLLVLSFAASTPDGSTTVPTVLDAGWTLHVFDWAYDPVTTYGAALGVWTSTYTSGSDVSLSCHGMFAGGIRRHAAEVRAFRRAGQAAAVSGSALDVWEGAATTPPVPVPTEHGADYLFAQIAIDQRHSGGDQREPTPDTDWINLPSSGSPFTALSRWVLPHRRLIDPGCVWADGTVVASVQATISIADTAPGVFWAVRRTVVGTEGGIG